MTTLSASSQDQLHAAQRVVRQHTASVPRVAIVLGSGLAGLARQINVEVAIPYSQIPGCRSTTTLGHQSELILGTLDGVSVAALSGRLHRYEGYRWDEIVFTTRLMSACGAECLIVSNAAGGVSPHLRVGDIVVIRDHVNWLGVQNQEHHGTPLLSPIRSASVYDEELSQVAMKVARDHHVNAVEGTYLATLGPNYETRAEYRMMRQIGVDVVGMSTVPEVLTASGIGMRVIGLSMVSNVANPDVALAADHNEVLEAGRLAESKMETIVSGVVRSLSTR